MSDNDPIIMNESPVASGDLKQDRRMSDEWGRSHQGTRLWHSILKKLTVDFPPDASKTPPSRFQKRRGSIYATPPSRDGHVDKNYADKYHAKIAEMNTKKSKSK